MGVILPAEDILCLEFQELLRG
jgi:hypothetical protein